MTQKYTIISDPGVDDLIALLLLYKLSPTPEHTLISTFGNVPEKYTSRNAREFIIFLARHWNYAHGAIRPLKTLEYGWPTYFHGSDGVWNIHPSVGVDEIKVQEDFPKNSNIISLGPMTTPYSLLQYGEIRDITIMGGAFGVSGNETEYAETNIAFDPDGAENFFADCKDVDTKIVPLDVTGKVFWSKEKVLGIPEDADYKIWAKKLLLAWFDGYGDKNQANFELYDPLCVYSVFYPKSLEWTTSGIKVITDGEKRGQTVFTKKNPSCRIALEVPDPEKVSDKMFDIVFD